MRARHRQKRRNWSLRPIHPFRRPAKYLSDYRAQLVVDDSICSSGSLFLIRVRFASIFDPPNWGGDAFIADQIEFYPATLQSRE